MPIEIRMPALSPTMTEGNLARWLKKEGDEVHSGDVIAEIETDKATMEYEAVDEGRLGKIIVPEGAQGIKVNQPIACCWKRARTRPRLRMPGARRQPSRRAAGRPKPGNRRRAAAAGRPSRRPHRPRAGERDRAQPSPAQREGEGQRRRRAATAKPASSPVRWRAAWRSMPGST